MGRFRISMPSNLTELTMPLYDLLWVVFLVVQVHTGTKIYDSKRAKID